MCFHLVAGPERQGLLARGSGPAHVADEGGALNADVAAERERVGAADAASFAVLLRGLGLRYSKGPPS